MRRWVGNILSVLGCLVLLGFPAAGSITAVPKISPASPQAVGTPITIAFKAVDSAPGPVNYRLDVAPPGGTFQTVHDFNLLPSFVWAQNLVEGTYQLRITARDNITGQQSVVTVPYTITSRVTAGSAVVTPTANPLVALFSAPPCPAGSTMQVVFYPLNNTSFGSVTDARPCGTGTSMNFLIGGMYANTIYNMNYLVTTNGVTTGGPAPVQFTTGVIPTGAALTPTVVNVPASLATSLKEKMLLTSFGNPNPPEATDLAGVPLWYYSGPQPEQTEVHRMAPKGTMTTISGGGYSITGTGLWPPQSEWQLVQLVDLAGNIIRETNVDRVNEQLPSNAAITNFDHDDVLLPNGHILAIASTQQIFPAGTQGNSAPISIIGRVLLDLDTNMQVAWYWNAFDHDGGNGQLDISRPATLGDICVYKNSETVSVGCPTVLLTSPANDWLHANAIQYEPDGSVIMSVRDQDWIIDIDYANGTGTGNVLWRMGLGGDFTMLTPGAYPWFSHQHDTEFTLGGMTSLTVFDNGNTRITQNGGGSRGMVLNVDVPNRTVSWSFVRLLPYWSVALGSAQRLSNGDYMFLAGDIPYNNATAFSDQSNEYATNGAETYGQGANVPAYRAFRVPSLYAPANGGGVNQ